MDSTAAASTATAPVDYRLEWTDPKRYLWLLGLIVPLDSVHRLGPGRADWPGRDVVGGAVCRVRRDPLP